MNRIILKPLAKINLGLDVTGTRDDGYHTVRMVMQTLKLHDHLVIEKANEDIVTIKTNKPYLPTDERNIAVKAAKLIKEEYGITEGIRMNLKKVIPVAGGMAGGSTDAAAVLYGMNLLFGLKLSTKRLMKLGVRLGADVPYCILRGTALAEGKGEELTTLHSAPNTGVLVVKPNFSVSTPSVYKEFDAIDKPYHPDIDGLIESIDNGDYEGMCRMLGNSLEDVTISNHPVIRDIKEKMMELKADASLMSGSGPTVFGLYKDKEALHMAAEYFRGLDEVREVYETSFYNVRGRK